MKKGENSFPLFFCPAQLQDSCLFPALLCTRLKLRLEEGDNLTAVRVGGGIT